MTEGPALGPALLGPLGPMVMNGILELLGPLVCKPAGPLENWGPPTEPTEGPTGPVGGPVPGPRPLFWSGCFNGWQTGQSFRVQLFQWQIICRDDEQWGTGQDLPDWHDVMWVSTFFIVRQWGKGHCSKNIQHGQFNHPNALKFIIITMPKYWFVKLLTWELFFVRAYTGSPAKNATLVTLTPLSNIQNHPKDIFYVTKGGTGRVYLQHC